MNRVFLNSSWLFIHVFYVSPCKNCPVKRSPRMWPRGRSSRGPRPRGQSGPQLDSEMALGLYSKPQSPQVGLKALERPQ